MAHNSTTVRVFRVLARVLSVLAPKLAARWLERLFLTPTQHQTPTREKDWLVGAQVSWVRFDQDRRLPIYTWGRRGPTVLLVHGWSGRGSQLGAFVAPLLSRGFRVVAFDAPSHGRADGSMSGLPEFATAIERVVEQVGPFKAIVAHSMGTAATTVALSRGLTLERAVYVSPPDNPGDYLFKAAEFLGFGDRIARRARLRMERRFRFPFEGARGTSLALGLDLPLLVIHDRGDKEVPYEEGAHLAEVWPGAEVLTTKGLGHRRILRASEVVEAGGDFLAQACRAAVA